MSAFICRNLHITALAVYAARNRVAGHTDARAVGEILLAENARSVNYRYGEANTPRFELCEWAAFHPFSRAQIVKAAACLDYQSCEHPGWEGSEAWKIVRAIAPGDASGLPGYDEAQWHITPPPPVPSTADILADPRRFLPPEPAGGHGPGKGPRR